MKTTTLAAVTLALAGAFSASTALAQTPSGTPGASSTEVPAGKPGNPAKSSESSGYPGRTTDAGAQNQPRNGGATGSAGKRPLDGRAPVNPASKANNPRSGS